MVVFFHVITNAHWNNAISKSNDKLLQEPNLLEIMGIYDIIRKCTATLNIVILKIVISCITKSLKAQESPAT